MNIVRLAALVWLGSVFPASSAFSAGFAIIEQSVTGLGNAYAGAAASADDASTLFFNPAGMSRLESPQLMAGLHWLSPQARFHNEGSITHSPTGPLATEGPDSSGGRDAIVPNLYYVHPVSGKVTAGIGVHSPFGLVTEYDDGWVGRYTALKSDLMTVSINPSLSYRLTPQLSIGLGVSAQHADVTLTNAIDLNRDGSPLLDGLAHVQGTDWGYGGNVGLLYELSRGTRIGVAYRSPIKHNLRGSAQFMLPNQLPAGLQAVRSAFVDQAVTADLTLPETVSFSVFHQLTQRVALMSDVTWTRWSRFDYLDVDFSNPLSEAVAGGAVPELWTDTLRYSAGVTYRIADSLLLRSGVAYDESPVPGPEYRSPRIPDNNRIWFALGFTWSLSHAIDLSAGYVHIWVDDPVVDNDTHTDGQRLIGTIQGGVDIISLGTSYSF